jgi:hypothetical protein
VIAVVVAGIAFPKAFEFHAVPSSSCSPDDFILGNWQGRRISLGELESVGILVEIFGSKLFGIDRIQNGLAICD